MPNVTYSQILSALATLIAGAHADLTGRVFQTELFAANSQELVDILQSFNGDKKSQGALVRWKGWTSSRDGASSVDGSVFRLNQVERFAVDIFYPYDSASSSTQTFWEIVSAVRKVLNKKDNANLGLGGSVLHQLIQAETDLSVQPFVEAQLHHAPLTIPVGVVIDACDE